MQALKSIIKKFLLKTFWKFDKDKLKRRLAAQGIKQGDRLIVHSSWRAHNGFSGTPKEFIDALKELVSNQGLLIMMSMPYQNQSTKEYLTEEKVFNIRRTPSKMGLLTEVFRRGKDVLRSLNSAHPILVWGAEGEALIKGHEFSRCSFGTDSPFDRMAKQGCKILLIDSPFDTITFNHYIEAMYESSYPVPLFEESSMKGELIDGYGNSLSFTTRVLSKLSANHRVDSKIQRKLNENKKITEFRVGNATFALLHTNDLLRHTDNKLIESL